jgi:hypothetical protein
MWAPVRTAVSPQQELRRAAARGGRPRRFWPAGEAIGKRIKVGPPENEPWLTIVGVVGDVRNVGLDADPSLATYEPWRNGPVFR